MNYAFQIGDTIGVAPSRVSSGISGKVLKVSRVNLLVEAIYSPCVGMEIPQEHKVPRGSVTHVIPLADPERKVIALAT